MDYDTTPDCVCGGTGRIPFSEDDPFSLIPCGECIARYDRNFCPVCDTRHTGTDPTYPWVYGTTRWVCGKCVQPAIKALQVQKQELKDQIKAVEDNLWAYRNKCPTCHCRLLPGQMCGCCADADDPYEADEA